ncbi:hypothetical protein K437DRAFT_43434 [Tilletiaria anomala UBC 951]|uniref:Nuclear protein DGCR14 n=1 Tax=Tilletiaria anomala (strain ATCC 24038 / CBS 436.72 / UBC 951) TaxID=1037660 RepID=A0A066VF32_TILAU|nr:uncharacterized protein K437DRAFT_43434 [Tilletiaria anomala UBC 951]KDN37210.1 hypothetical protein K437DRAFT_43434 [Tilletiaria anomala UBC 951]
MSNSTASSSSQALVATSSTVSARTALVRTSTKEGTSSTPLIPVGPRLEPHPPAPPPQPLPPKATHSHRGARILSEESYTSALSSIIQRDFFPDLARLCAENEYLDALDDPDADEQRVRRAVRRLVRLEEGLGVIPPTPRRNTASSVKRAKGNERAEVDTPFLYTATRGWDEDAQTPRIGRRAAESTPGATPFAGSGACGEWESTPTHVPEFSGGNGGIAMPGTSAVWTGQEAADLYNESDDEEPLGGESMSAVPPSEIHTHSLSSFERNYTSVDNASFGSLLAKVNAERRQKYAWAFVEENRARIKWNEAREEEHRTAQTGARLAIEEGRVPETKLVTGVQGKLAIEGATASPPQGDGTVIKLEAEQPLDDRQHPAPSAVTSSGRSHTKAGWSFTARNSFMFPPDADRSTLVHRSSSLEHAPAGTGTRTRGAYASGFGGDQSELGRVKPSINLVNLRLPQATSGCFGDEIASSSAGGQTPRLSVLNAAIEGQRQSSSSSSFSASSALGGGGSGSADDGGHAAACRLTVNGHRFVSPLPSPRPGDFGAERMRQLMTWGTIVRTPVVLREGRSDAGVGAGEAGRSHTPRDGGVGGFAMPPTPRREELARQLAAVRGAASSPLTLASAASAAGKRAERTSGHGKASATAAGLSPAAQRLLERTAAAGVTPRRTSQPMGLRSDLGTRLIGRKRVGHGQGQRQRHSVTGSSRPDEGEDEDDQLARLKRRRWTPTPSPSPAPSRGPAQV